MLLTLLQGETPPDLLETIAVIIGNIIGFVKPYVSPIGEWMVVWVQFLLQYFPDSNLLMYIVIYIGLIVAALIVNIKWAGDYQSDEDV